jgi:hypothetical protein
MDEELRDTAKVDDMGKGATGTYSFCRIMDDLQVRGGTLVEALRCELEVRGFSSSCVHFFIGLFLPAAVWSWGRLSL